MPGDIRELNRLSKGYVCRKHLGFRTNVKGESILLSSSGAIKLADFGFNAEVRDSSLKSRKKSAVAGIFAE